MTNNSNNSINIIIITKYSMTNTTYRTVVILLSVSSNAAECATRKEPRNLPFCFWIFSHWTPHVNNTLWRSECL